MAEDGVNCRQLLRRLRQLARLTQEDLAQRSGDSANELSKLERDEWYPPGGPRPPGRALGLESRAHPVAWRLSRELSRVYTGFGLATPPAAEGAAGREESPRRCGA
jgi:hypothetical protein